MLLFIIIIAKTDGLTEAAVSVIILQVDALILRSALKINKFLYGEMAELV